MPWDLLIRNALVVTPEGVYPLDLAVEAGAIVDVASEIHGSSRRELDATGLHCFPGAIDPHVHFNEPGRADWEGFATGSAALVAGGGTCFFDMPLNSSPPTLDAASFDLKHAAARAGSRADFALWGGLTPHNVDKLEELADRGVIGFKAFMCPSGIDDFAHADSGTLERGMQVAARLGLPVAVHAESEAITRRLTDAKSRGQHDWQAYLDSRPVEAEVDAIVAAVAMAGRTGCSLYVVHVSSPEGVRAALRARAETGAHVTIETCPHYLLLEDAHLIANGARFKCAPPLRSRDQRDALNALLASGDVDVIGSDHSPSPPTMKVGDDAFAIWGGIAGVQSTLAAMLTHASAPAADSPFRRELDSTTDLMAMPRQNDAEAHVAYVASLTASHVADQFMIPRKGVIDQGCDADLTLVDLGQTYELSRDALLDRHKLSPYVGRSFRGVVRHTFVRGHEVCRDGQIVADRFRGQLIKPIRRARHA
jgi:allantoinase